jgi:hypothetical protein
MKNDITGKKYGMLQVIGLHKKGEYTGTYWKDQIWECLCDCGKQHFVPKGCLTKGHTKSCGCLRIIKGKQMFKGVGELSKSHWNSITRHAKDRKIKIEITIDDAWNKFLSQQRLCALSNIKLIFAENRREEEKGGTTASLDRIDSSLGYTKNNIQWVHKDINKMKWNYDQDYFIELCKTIAKNN